MLNVAYFSPLPPAPTGIADYSLDLIEPLSQVTRLTLFAQQPLTVKAELREHYPVEPAASYPQRRWDFDVALYHMGNSGNYHQPIYEMALRYPGIVVLHEVFLPDFTAHSTIGHGDYAAYAREIGYELGAKGYELAWRWRLGHRSPDLNTVMFNKRLIDRSLGIVVHSQSAAELVRRQNEDRPLEIIDQLVVGRDVASLRQRLNVSDQVTIFASLGEMNPNKQIDLTLDAFARLKQVEPDVFFLIVGAASATIDLPKLISQRGLQQEVLWTGRVESLDEFVGWLTTADVVINLRHPSLGETSNVAVRALAAGKPLIVYDQGWSSELPSDLCRHVAPLDTEALYEAMLYMVRQPDARQAMGRSAADYAARRLNPDLVAKHYVRFMEEVLAAARAQGAEIGTSV
jgi:glycosyltransferase involved in cell wall biosynthesis